MVEAIRGRSHSEVTKLRIGLSNKGHFHTEEYKRRSSLERGGVKIKTLPLFLRGAMAHEIVEITDLKAIQIARSRDGLRKSGELPKSTKSAESLIKRKAHLGKPRAGIREYLKEQQNSFSFARKFCEVGLIGKDLAGWEKLHQIFSDQEKELPEAFSDKLRLEIFLRAVEEAKKGDRSLLKKYNEWGRELDPVWFEKSLADTEGFIIDLNDDEILAYALSRPLPQYPEQIRETVVRLDRTGLGLGEKQAILTYLVLYGAEGGWVENVAELLGIPVCDARAKIASVLKTLSEEGWEVMERLADNSGKLTVR